MGTRSPVGSENITIFASLVQTAKLQDAPVLPIMHALLFLNSWLPLRSCTSPPFLAESQLISSSALANVPSHERD